MKIAIAADGKNLNCAVTEEFATCKYLLIVHMENLNVAVIENSGDETGVILANELINHGCEGVICGKLKPEAFDLLVKACVTRYLGTGHYGQKALALMEKNALKYIKNHEAHHLK